MSLCVCGKHDVVGVARAHADSWHGGGAKGDPILLHRYWSLADALDVAGRGKDDRLAGDAGTLAAGLSASSRQFTRGFNELRDYSAWVALALGGDRARAEAVEETARRMTARIMGECANRIIWKRGPVPEGALLIPAFIAGRPDCFQVPRRRKVPGKGKVLRIAVNLSASCAVPHEILKTRSIAALALVTALEASGHLCELWLCSAVNGEFTLRSEDEKAAFGGEKTKASGACFAVRAKAQGASVDLEYLAAWGGTADGFRRGFFGLYEHMESFMEMHRWGYGYPAPLPAGLGGDCAPLEEPARSDDPRFSSVENAEKWLREELVQRGVLAA